MSGKRSLGNRRGVKRIPYWPRRQPRQLGQRARAPWADDPSTTEQARAGRKAQDPEAMAPEPQSRSRRPGAVWLKNSLGQRRGVERAPHWPRRQSRQVFQRARAPWADGRSATRRSARGPRGPGVGSYGRGVSKPQPPTWRGVGEEEPRPTAWGRACSALGAPTITPSPPTSASSVGGQPVIHGARGGRAARISEAEVTKIRSRSSGPGAVSVKKRLG